MPEWAAGLADPELDLEIVEFAPANDFGVLDHLVRMPGGEEVLNPMRIIAYGATGGCEVVFTLRRRADQTDEEFETDAEAVRADLRALKALVEASPGTS